MDGSSPKIDFTRIDFPSDKLTVDMLRKTWPDAFDLDRMSGLGRAPHRCYIRHSLDNILGDGLVDLERLLAERAFKVSLGLSIEKDDRIRSKSDLIEPLIGSYINCGLAHGRHEVAVMVRRIEAQAEAQARQQGKPPR